MTRQRSFRALWLGCQPYGPTHELQSRLFEARRQGHLGDTILLLEHAPVITRGRGARNAHLLASPEELRRLGVDTVDTGRGGDVTLHAPGQLIAYPIFDLSPDWQDVRRYVRTLSNVMADVVAMSGIDAGTLDRYIGLWADAASPGHWPGEGSLQTPLKLGAIGVRISRWITMHGFALNLHPDLSLFRLIVPCGIQEYGVTSVQQLMGAAPAVPEAATRALESFVERFSAGPAHLEDLSHGTPETIEAFLLGRRPPENRSFSP
jgi:lipoyl(octanoyl) transferase